MDKITLDQEYQTRCGYPVKLYTVEGRVKGYPIVGEVHAKDGAWFQDTWCADGRWHKDTPVSNLDLIPVPKKLKLECWVDVYKYGLQDGCYYATRAMNEMEPTKFGGMVLLKSIHVQDEVSL